MELDNEQKLAVTTDASKVIVASGAGAGKTRVIIERLKYLTEQGVDPRHICAITFTNAAAEEMRQRIGQETDIFIGTIHSLANRILLINGVDTNKYLEEENFDALLEEIHNRDVEMPIVDYLLVDEFQDVCENEYNFMFKDLRPKNWFVVGDSRQAIYGFKGANYKYFLDLIRNPEVQVYELNNNYRSGSEIIEFADMLLCSVSDIYRTKMVSKKGDRGFVWQTVFSVDNIVDEILRDPRYSDWFILCRTNQEVEDMLLVLKRNSIPAESFKKADLDLNSLQEKMSEETVKVLTIHTAKGLEAKNVIVVGARMWNDEEKRISYVAATRAKQNLIWLYQKKKPQSRKKKITFGDF